MGGGGSIGEVNIGWMTDLILGPLTHQLMPIREIRLAAGLIDLGDNR